MRAMPKMVEPFSRAIDRMSRLLKIDLAEVWFALNNILSREVPL